MEAPLVPPSHLEDDYTLQQRVPLASYYVDDSNKGQGSHYKFSAKYIERMINHSIPEQLSILQTKGFAPDEEEKASQEDFDSMFLQLLDKNYWPLVALWHMKSLLQGKKVAVFGSIDPYFECVALYFGADLVTTFEYNELTFEHNQLHVVTSDRYKALIEAVEQDDLSQLDYARFSHFFDVALSFSSFDHSGLGRYGDPLDPYGDLRAISFVRKLLKDDGIGQFVLSLPVGPDVTVWNLHRRYGTLRLPMCLAAFFYGAEAAIEGAVGANTAMEMSLGEEGEAESEELFYKHDVVIRHWPEVLRVGWYSFKLSQPAPFTQTYEPILIFYT